VAWRGVAVAWRGVREGESHPLGASTLDDPSSFSLVEFSSYYLPVVLSTCSSVQF